MGEQYAVVQNSAEKRFTMWHDTLEAAREEAERLCKKEQKQFIVLRVIAVCKIDERPVKWEER